MYIETVRNRNSPPAILLREGWREGKKVRKRTLANLSHLPKNIIALIRRALKGEAFVAVSEAFEVIKSSLHGHVNACRTTMRRLRFDKLLASKPCRERNLVEAMVAARILEPDSKLATTRWWHTTTLPESLGVADANEDDLYAAMDWLLERQERIEKKLAGRHLKKGGLVLYDLSSSYFEGVTCPLAAMGYSRDGKRDRLQVNYGLVTDERGCPVAVSVFAGNESDSTTLMPQVEMVRNRFGIKTLVLVCWFSVKMTARLDVNATPGVRMSPLAPGIVPECSGASRVKRAARAGFAALDSPCALWYSLVVGERERSGAPGIRVFMRAPCYYAAHAAPLVPAPVSGPAPTRSLGPCQP